MTLLRNNPSRDDNEPEIAEYMQKAGYVVTRISGAGIPDLLCVKPNPGPLYIARNASDASAIAAAGHEIVLIEVKNGKSGLTKSQTKWWQRHGKI